MNKKFVLQSIELHRDDFIKKSRLLITIWLTQRLEELQKKHFKNHILLFRDGWGVCNVYAFKEDRLKLLKDNTNEDITAYDVLKEVEQKRPIDLRDIHKVDKLVQPLIDEYWSLTQECYDIEVEPILVGME